MNNQWQLIFREWNKELQKRTDSKNKKYKPSILKAITRAFWFKFAAYQQINIWGEILIRLSQPFLVGFLVRYLSQANGVNNSNFTAQNSTFPNDGNSTNDLRPDAMMNRAYVSHQSAINYAVILIASSFLFAFSRHPAFVLCLRVGSNIRTALTVMIYRKILRLSKSSFEQTDIGQILNILANDLNRFEDVSWQLPYILIGPTMSAVVIYISYKYLGIACVGGLVILILFIPFQGLMGRLFNTFR